MKGFRRANWILAGVTWGLAAFCGLSNLFAWESAWMLSCMIWALLAQLSGLISFCALFCVFFEDDPAEKKASILGALIVIAISVLAALLMTCVFSTWFGFGELFGEC